MNQTKSLAPHAPKNMPDIASEATQALPTTLNWVGMAGMRQPIEVTDGSEFVRVNARSALFVNLENPEAKGIHMSRLYLQLNELARHQALAPASIEDFCQKAVQSHEKLSSAALVEFRFDHLVNRKALLSDNYGWNAYPIKIKGVYANQTLKLEVAVEVLYSSTCPCSSALAWQINEESFSSEFAGQSQVSAADVRAWLSAETGTKAVPHSQRSSAQVAVQLQDVTADRFHITTLIDLLESALKTPVQTAVKREDEQEFARLNGNNQMFCEDAARRLKIALMDDSAYADFRLRVNHMESLHAHDAVAMVVKGVAGGYQCAIS